MNRLIKLTVVLLFVVCSVVFNACSMSTTTKHSVKYEITGTSTSVNVTLNNATGGTEQFSDVTVPHTYTYDDYTSSFLYISAQNNGETGSVTVKIYLDGVVTKTSTSSGAYTIATASDSLL